MRKSFLYILSLVTVSCTALDYEGTGGELVVEGWITDGAYPVVLLSRTIPASTQWAELSSVLDYTEYFARVTLSDGDREVKLVGKRDKRYIPAYQYVTTEMKGETGRTYTVTVRTEDGLTAHCTGRICRNVPLDTVRAVRMEDGEYTIEATFRNCPADSLYYRFFVKVEGKDEIWMPSVLGTVDGSTVDGTVTATVNSPMGSLSDKYKLTYSPGSRVYIRFCTMERTMYDYWSAFDGTQTIVMNPFVPSKDNLPAIVTGARGYWAGYGTYETVIDIPKD